MDISNMVELVNMIKSLDTTLEDGRHRWICDWVYGKDGKSIIVRLSNNEQFEFNVI